MVEMRERIRRRLSWFRILVKIIIVLIFPIRFYVDIFSNNNNWISILFSIDSFNTIVFDPILTITTAIILMLPGIYFDLKIHSSPISTSIRRKATFIAIVTWLFPFGLIFLGIFTQSSTGLGTIYAISFIPTLAIPIFIVLPIINRELIIRSSPANLHTYSFSYLYNGFKKRFGRRRFLPILIWGGLFLSPLIMQGPWGEMSLISIFYGANFGGVYFFDSLSFYSVNLNLVPAYIFPGYLLLFSIRLVFIRDIYRFCDGKVTKSRLISIGLLAEIAPVAVMTLIYTVISIGMGVFPGSFAQFIFPTPIFPLLGYLYVRLSNLGITPDELWDDEEYRMWFEEGPPTPPPGQQPMEHRIKVPISYLIVSQFRKLRNK